MNPVRLGLSRRKALGALGIGGLAALTGCRSAVSEANGTGSTRPQAGGTLRAGILTDLIPGNLMTNSTNGITTVLGLVYERLVRYPNDTIEPLPWLATSWRLADDGRSLTLNLRDDVTFHTGRAFTSEDVRFSVATYADPKWNGQMLRTAQAISRVDTAQPHRVVLHFTHRLGNIFDLLAVMPIVDRETAHQIGTGTRFVGTGPFVFESWTPNSELVFRRYRNYRVKNRPYLDGVHVSVIPDAASLATAIKAGQIDFANGVNYRDIESLTAQPRFRAVTLTGAEQQIYVGANVTAAPLNDRTVRQAIAYAVDRKRVMAEVFRNAGRPVNLPWPTYSPAYDAELNSTYPTAPARARKLLGGRRMPSIPLTYIGSTPAMASTALIVQSNLKDAGIPVKLDPVDDAQFVKMLIGGKFPGLWSTLHSWAQFEPSTLTVSAFPFNADKNASRFTSSTYSSDADAAWRVTDGTSTAAKADYGRLSADLLRYLFLIEIGIVLPQWVTSARLRGVSYTKIAEVDLRDAYLT